MDLRGTRGHLALGLNGQYEDSLFNEGNDNYHGRPEPSHIHPCRRHRAEQTSWNYTPQPPRPHQQTMQHPQDPSIQLPALHQVFSPDGSIRDNSDEGLTYHPARYDPTAPLPAPIHWSIRETQQLMHSRYFGIGAGAGAGAGVGEAGSGASSGAQATSLFAHAPYSMQAQWAHEQALQGNSYRNNSGNSGLDAEPQRFPGVNGRTMDPRATSDFINSGGVSARPDSSRHLIGNPDFPPSSPTETEAFSHLPLGPQPQRRSRPDANENPPAPFPRPPGTRAAVNLARLRHRQMHPHLYNYHNHHNHHQAGSSRSGSPSVAYATDFSQVAPRSPGGRRRVNSASRTYRNMASRHARSPQSQAVGRPAETRLLILAPQLEEYLERHVNYYNRADKKKVASRKMIKTLIEVDVQELDEGDKACTICYQNFGEESPEGVTEKPVRLPKCKHVFGEECLKKWLLDSYQCPYCRAKMDGEPQALEQRDMEGIFNTLVTNGLVPSGRIPVDIAENFPRLYDFLLDTMEDGSDMESEEEWSSNGGEEEEEENDDGDEQMESHTPAYQQPSRDTQSRHSQPPARQPSQPRQPSQHSPVAAPRTPTPPTSQPPFTEAESSAGRATLPPLNSVTAFLLPMVPEQFLSPRSQDPDGNRSPAGPDVGFQSLLAAASTRESWLNGMPGAAAPVSHERYNHPESFEHGAPGAAFREQQQS